MIFDSGKEHETLMQQRLDLERRLAEARVVEGRVVEEALGPEADGQVNPESAKPACSAACWMEPWKVP